MVGSLIKLFRRATAANMDFPSYFASLPADTRAQFAYDAPKTNDSNSNAILVKFEKFDSGMQQGPSSWAFGQMVFNGGKGTSRTYSLLWPSVVRGSVKQINEALNDSPDRKLWDTVRCYMVDGTWIMGRNLQSAPRSGKGGGGSASAGERNDAAGESPLAGAKRPATAAALGSPDAQRRSAVGSSNLPLRLSTADAIASRVQASIKTAHAALRGAAADIGQLALLLPGNDAAALKAAAEHQAACHLMADDLSDMRSEVDTFIGSAQRTLETLANADNEQRASTGDSLAVHPAAAAAAAAAATTAAAPAAAAATAVEHIVRPAAAAAAAAATAATTAATPATAANAAEGIEANECNGDTAPTMSTDTTGTAGSTNHDSNSNVEAVLPDAGADAAGNAARSSPAF